MKRFTLIMSLLILTLSFSLAHATTTEYIEKQPIIEKNTVIGFPIQFGTITKYILKDDSGFSDWIIIKLPDNKTPQQYSVKVLESALTSSGKLTATTDNSEKNKDSLLNQIVTVDPENFTLQPGQEQKIKINIKNNNNLPIGTYTGAIVVEYLPVKNGNNQESKASTGLQFKTRSIYNFILEIPGEKQSELVHGDLSLTTNNDQIILSQDFSNNGNTLLRLSGTADYYLNNSLSESDQIGPAFLPADTSFTVKKTYQGKGLFQNIKFDFNVTVDEYSPEKSSYQTIKSISNSVSFTYLNWFYLKLIIGGLLLIILLFFCRITVCRAKLGNCLKYTVQNKDNLQKIANRFDMSWQNIVRLNKLRPPYSIKKGDTLYVKKRKSSN
jgi:hypothetical protein